MSEHDTDSLKKLIRAAYAAGYEAGANHYAAPDYADESSIFHDDAEPGITEYVESVLRKNKVPLPPASEPGR